MAYVSLLLGVLLVGDWLSLISASIKANGKIDGVVLTAGHSRVFETSMKSAMTYLVDIDIFYVLAPKAKELEKEFGASLGPRVIWVDESIFPVNWLNVSRTMIQSVRDKGVYPLKKKSHFEHMVYLKVGWFLQQLLKMYAGRILNIGDFVLLDSDLVWMRPVKFVHTANGNFSTYFYASSTQYHPPYMASMVRIGGVGEYKNHTENIHRSGIVHHMVIVYSVLEDLIRLTEELHHLPFWQVLLNQSAIEMTCRAPRASICGGGDTLSEYELYFNFAKARYPNTVAHRPLLWANGPAPGLLFWPPAEPVPAANPARVHWDGMGNKWKGYRHAETMKVLAMQIAADSSSGFDYIGYHSYAKRRFFQLHAVDVAALCGIDKAPLGGLAATPARINSTCSYRGLEEPERRNVEVSEWFKGCGCQMARGKFKG